MKIQFRLSSPFDPHTYIRVDPHQLNHSVVSRVGRLLRRVGRLRDEFVVGNHKFKVVLRREGRRYVICVAVFKSGYRLIAADEYRARILKRVLMWLHRFVSRWVSRLEAEGAMYGF